MELQHVIYDILKTQIQFGIYRFGERLPTIEEESRLFHVSIKTIRAAYQRLQKESYITMSQKVGVKVKVQYSEQNIRLHIQGFFSRHKDALIDLSCSMRPLFSQAQWLGFRNATPELLNKMERLFMQKEVLPPHLMIQLLQYIYGSLNNDLLMRLVCQVFMFYQAPFLSVPENLKNLETQGYHPFLHMIDLCREQMWTQLRADVDAFQEHLSHTLQQLYNRHSGQPLSVPQIRFAWSGYKKASQIRYSLGMELLVSISRGEYPAGSYLPSVNKLAQDKQVSVSTVRRAFSVLNGIGVTKSVNGAGTQVLPLCEIADNCDFTQQTVRNRMLEHAQSLQLLALSCKEVTELTIASVNAEAIELCKERLHTLQRTQRYELAAYGILGIIAQYAPYDTIRTVYTALFQQLLWGYPLRSMREDRETLNALFLPYFHSFMDCLERGDAAGLSSKLEALLHREVNFAAGQLVKLGIEEAAGLVLPDTDQ